MSKTAHFLHDAGLAAWFGGSLMGAIALLRQTFLDTRWQRERLAWQAQHREAQRLEANQALAALLPVVDGQQPLFFATSDELDYARALTLGREFGLKLSSWEELARGTIDGASVYAREVVKAALRHNAAAVIFAHNHPSGVREPSAADRVLTEKLKSALGQVEIRVLDHFVIGDGEPVSFAERGWL